MAHFMTKLWKRLRVIGLNALVHWLPPLFSITASLLVVHFSGEATWGAFVYPLIFAGLTMQVMNWGNKEFLLRAFARHPDRAGDLWRQSLVTRGTLIFMVLPLLLLLDFPREAAAMLLLWILAVQPYRLPVFYLILQLCARRDKG